MHTKKAVANGFQRALLISCSQRKRRDPILLQAIERYDGPAFRVLRRYLRNAGDPHLRVYILSAKFGIITPRTRIPYYNVRMTTKSRRENCERNTQKLKSLLRRYECKELFVCASNMYRQSLDESALEHLLPVRFAALGQGPKLASLKEWLRETSNG
jgi:cytoplasmic iron level regulating protein YaaA (DUF328/UPF0246 family)